MLRYLPPGAAPLTSKNLIHAARGFVHEKYYIKRLRQEILDYFGQKYCFFVSSGRAALTLILRCLKQIKPNRDEVIIPAYTCYSVAAAVVRAGCIPVLCDMSLETLDFDYKLLQEKISTSTLAIIPCNLFGIPSDMGALKKLINRESVFIIDDAAQAMGLKYGGTFIGTRGHVGFFSLDRGKNITTVKGGIILTNYQKVAEKLEDQISSLSPYSQLEKFILFVQAVIVSFFLSPYLFGFLAGIPFLGLGKTIYSTNFKLQHFSGVQAGLAHSWKDNLKKFNSIRKKNAVIYNRTIFSIKKDKNPVIKVPFETSPHRYPYLLPEKATPKEVIIKKCKTLGVGGAYPGIIADIPALQLMEEQDKYSKARILANRLITLPTHPYVKLSDVYKIIDSLSSLNAL